MITCNVQVTVAVNFNEVLCEPLWKLRALWEETSQKLELLQTNKECVAEQEFWLQEAKDQVYIADFDYSARRMRFKAEERLSMQSAVAPSTFFSFPNFCFN